MVAELVPSPPPLVGCLDALDEVLDSMPTEAYAGLDPALLRHAAERLRRIKARIAGAGAGRRAGVGCRAG